MAKPPLVVGAIVLLSAALAAVFSLEIVSFDPDELGYTHLARGIADSLTPFTVAYGGGQRLNQLYPLLIAPLWGVFGNVTAFRLTHVWNTVLMTSTAIPTYLMARDVVRARWAAYLAAALVAVAPWLTLSTSELTEVAAYPACAWAFLAMQRALHEPSPKRDLIALLAIAVATYGRLQLIVLAPVLVVAMLVHELGYGVTASGARRDGVRHAVKRLTRQHAVLSAAGAAGVLIGVPLLLSGKLVSAAGFYGDAFAGATINGATFDLARSYLTFIALGLGAIPAALTFGFTFETLIAPVSRRAHAFASIALVAVLTITLQVAEISVRFNAGTLEERYVFYIVPLLVVGMCAALLATRRPFVAVIGGSVALALLVGTTHYEAARSAFWHQVSPGMTSFYDLFGSALGAASGPSASPYSGRLVLAGIVVLAIGLCVGALARRFAPARVLAVVSVAVIAFCAFETTHALYRVVHGNSSGPGLGTGSIHNADWVDRALPHGGAVEQLVDNVGGLDLSNQAWEHDAFWNRSIAGAYTIGQFIDPYFPTTSLSIDLGSGAIAPVAYPGTALSPPYVTVAARGFPLMPVGVVVARSPNGSIELVRPAAPLRADWFVSGVSSDGWLTLYRRAEVRLFTLRGAVGRCVTVGLKLSLSSLVALPQVVTMASGGIERHATLTPGNTQTLGTRVCGRRSGVPALQFWVDQPASAAPPALTPQLLGVNTGPAS